jgi:hypothetical protein
MFAQYTKEQWNETWSKQTNGHAVDAYVRVSPDTLTLGKKTPLFWNRITFNDHCPHPQTS